MGKRISQLTGSCIYIMVDKRVYIAANQFWNSIFLLGFKSSCGKHQSDFATLPVHRQKRETYTHWVSSCSRSERVADHSMRKEKLWIQMVNLPTDFFKSSAGTSWARGGGGASDESTLALHKSILLIFCYVLFKIYYHKIETKSRMIQGGGSTRKNSLSTRERA